MNASVSSLGATVLAQLAPREPSCCPWCPEDPNPHWIRWGFYRRYAERRRQKIRVQRYRCRIKGRTFSLLPDGLLPYHWPRTTTILSRLCTLIVVGTPTSRLAPLRKIARTTLRRMRAAFVRALQHLRLPGVEGALEPRAFLQRLLAMGADRIADLFGGWKELEPKHSIVGIYPR